MVLEMSPNAQFTIKGHVKFPGFYALKEGMTLYDAIFKYGGYFDENFKNKLIRAGRIDSRSQ